MNLKPYYDMTFSKIYPFYVQKAKRKGRTRAEVDQIISWLTGYTKKDIDHYAKTHDTFKTFFDKAPAMHPKRVEIKGVICGLRVENIEDELARHIRYLDKLIDELAKGKPLEKILK